MNEQELGRYFEKFVKTVFEDNSVNCEFEKKIKLKSSVLFNQTLNETNVELRHRKNYYEPDFIINKSIWIECTTKIKNAPKKELLYAHQCSKLIILYLYQEDITIQPYFRKTTYQLIDDYLIELGVLSKYVDELDKLRKMNDEK